MSQASLDLRVTGGWEMTNDNGLRAAKRSGKGDEPSRSIELVPGDGSQPGQIDTIYRLAFTLGANATLNIDLKGGTGELDVLNAPLDLASVLAIEVLLTTAPGEDVSVRVGPTGQANGWIGPFKDVNAWQSVRRRFFQDGPDGWIVDATHKILRIHNPGAESVSGVLELFGISS